MLSMASQTKDKDCNYLISSEVTAIAEFLIIIISESRDYYFTIFLGGAIISFISNYFTRKNGTIIPIILDFGFLLLFQLFQYYYLLLFFCILLFQLF